MIAKIKNFLFQPISKTRYEQILTVFGHLFFLTFMLFSLLFYKERLINFDSAFFTFKLLTEQDFYAAHSRYISVAPQIFPLIAIKLGGSLKMVMIVYSLSFMLLYYGVFLVIRYVFRNSQAGVFLALCLCLAFRYKYYTAISEITASLSLFALVVAWLSKDWRSVLPKVIISNATSNLSFQDKLAQVGILNVRFWVIGFLLLLLALFAGHKLVLVPILIYLGYEFLFNYQYRNRAFIGLLGLFLGSMALTFLMVAERSYEGQQLNRLDDTWAVLTNLNDYYIWELLKWYFECEYAFPAIVFLVGIGWVCYQKKWMQAFYFLLANIGIGALVLVHNSYLNGKILFMVDGYFGYFGVVWALFFYLYFIKPYQNNFILIITFLLLFFGVHRIYQTHEFYTQRLEYYQQISDSVNGSDNRKLVFHKRLFSWGKVWSPVFIKHESLLFSALESPDSAFHLTIGYNPKSIENMRNTTNSLHGIGKIEDLPKQYFRFGNEGYIELEKVPWQKD